MEHALLGFSAVAILLGAGGGFLSLLLFLKYRQRVLLYVGLWALTSVFLATAEALMVYSGVTLADIRQTARAAYFVIHLTCWGVTLYAIPAGAHVAIGRELSRRARIGLSAILAAYCLFAGILLIMEKSDIYLELANAAFGVAFLYGMLRLLIHYPRFRNGESRSVVRTVLVICFVFVPSILAYHFLEVADVVPLPFGRWPVLNFLGLWAVSITGIYYIAKYFFVSIARVERLLSSAAMERFGITSREREVLHLLLKGYSSRMISATLFIAPKTAKNHIYRIYRKVGVQSRIELFRSLGTAP